MGRLRTVTCAAAVAVAALVAPAALAAPAWTAHAQEDDGGPIPEWLRIVFGYYADGLISDDEMLAALQYLVDQGAIRIGPVQDAAPSMSEEAEWAADEAEYVDAIADRLRDDMRAFRVQLHAGTFIPGEPADYEDAFEAGRAEIKAAKEYADALRSAAADGRMTSTEQAEIDDARLVVEAAEEASYKAILATPMATELKPSHVMDKMVGGRGDTAEQGGAQQGSYQASAPEAQPHASPRSIETAAEAADEADYLADLAENRRKNLRNFELGLAGSDYRSTGDFGSAGSSAAYAADGNIGAYNPMIDAIREAIRAGERLAGILEDAATDGKISAAETDAIASAKADATGAGRAAAAAYDATSYAQDYQHGMFASFIDGFR